MKIRCGFVSNSSTSSFSIFGIETNHDELANVLFPEFKKEKVPVCPHDFDRQICKFCPECGKAAWREFETSVYVEDLEKAVNALGFSMVGDGEPHYYVGDNLRGRGGKRGALKRIDELKGIGEKLEKLFGREADFHSGEYSS